MGSAIAGTQGSDLRLGDAVRFSPVTSDDGSSWALDVRQMNDKQQKSGC